MPIDPFSYVLYPSSHTFQTQDAEGGQDEDVLNVASPTAKIVDAMLDTQ